MTVHFYDSVADECLAFAVIIARYQGAYVFCKHKQRDTLEIPGGHREPNETIDQTAARELYEETGACQFELKPICVYSVRHDHPAKGAESFGMLYYAEIETFENELQHEIEQIVLSTELPAAWTYPLIQPRLIEEAKRRNVFTD